MVAFGPHNLACEPESAGVGGGRAVPLCQHRDMKTPSHSHDRAFPLTRTCGRFCTADSGSAVAGVAGRCYPILAAAAVIIVGLRGSVKEKQQVVRGKHSSGFGSDPYDDSPVWALGIGARHSGCVATEGACTQVGFAQVAQLFGAPRARQGGSGPSGLGAFGTDGVAEPGGLFVALFLDGLGQFTPEPLERVGGDLRLDFL